MERDIVRLGLGSRIRDAMAKWFVTLSNIQLPDCHLALSS